ncbi:hypothetical protein ABZ927_31615 [Streptomyces massasporeus]
MEAVQFATGADVLGLARRVLDDPASPYREIRFAGLRLAESRGMWRPGPER